MSSFQSLPTPSPALPAPNPGYIRCGCGEVYDRGDFHPVACYQANRRVIRNPQVLNQQLRQLYLGLSDSEDE